MQIVRKGWLYPVPDYEIIAHTRIYNECIYRKKSKPIQTQNDASDARYGAHCCHPQQRQVSRFPIK